MARHRRFVSAGLLVAGLLSAAALPGAAEARERLADPDVQVHADEADGGPATREGQRRRANEDDWFRAPVRDAANDAGVADFPSGEVHDAVVANARAAAARVAFRRAESALAAAVRAARESFETSAELRDALAAERRAQDKVELARNEALRDVVGNAKYQAMQELRENLSQQILERRDSASQAYEHAARVRFASAKTVVDPGQPDGVVAMAELKMRVGSDARAMEREALLRADAVRTAQQELAAASAKVSALRAEFDRKVRQDPNLKQARESLEDSRAARVVAETYFNGANLAAGRALDFAYATHRYDYYRYNHSTDLYPYAPYYGYAYRGGYGFASRRYQSIP